MQKYTVTVKADDEKVGVISVVLYETHGYRSDGKVPVETAIVMSECNSHIERKIAHMIRRHILANLT